MRLTHPNFLKTLAALPFFLMFPAGVFADGDRPAVDLSGVPQIHETPQQRDARMQWWRDAKFGMFLHWGPVSLFRQGAGLGPRRQPPVGHLARHQRRAPKTRTTTTSTSSSTR